MGDLRNFYRESSHYLGGRLAVMLLGFISFPIFTRIFSVAEYGIINLVLQTVLVLTALSKLGLQNAVQRFYPDYSHCRGALRRYFSSLFFGAGLAGILIIAVFVVGLQLLPAGTFSAPLRMTLLLGSALILIRSLRQMQCNLMQVEGNTKLYNGLEIVAKAASVVVTCALVLLWHRSVAAYFGGTIIVELLVLLSVIAWLTRRHLLSLAAFDANFLRIALRFSVPLLTAEVVWIFLDSGDRFFIQHFLGSEAVGYYSVAYGIAYYVQDLVMTPLNLALFPTCLQIWSKQGKQATQEFLSRSLDHFIMAAVGLVCVFVLTSKDLVLVLASSKFLQASKLLPTLVCGLMLSAVSIFLKPALLIHNKCFSFAKVTAYACATNVVANVLLLPRIGLWGAAMATLISYAVWIALLAYESMRALPFRVDLRATVRYLAAAGFTMLLVRHVHFNAVLVNLVARGTLTALLYFGAVITFDRRYRQVFRSLVPEPRKPVTAIAEMASTPDVWIQSRRRR